ncbi:restriction endonuclease [Caldinitratiruptor microaerophilus]|nr:restriction endonuclease [Caldinitratiruptor microaerophilus]
MGSAIWLFLIALAFTVVLGLIKLGFEMLEEWLTDKADDIRLGGKGVRETYNMSGLDFEKWLERQFRNAGFTVERTPYQGDKGADLILVEPNNGRRWVVQAKRWRRPVGIRAVQEALAAKAYYKAHIAMVVTNSHGFTPDAQDMAKRTGVVLMSRTDLAKYVEQINRVRGAQQR